MGVEVDFGLTPSDPSTYLDAGREMARAMLGFGTPAEQVVSSVLIGGIALVSSTVSLGATLVIFVFAMLTFGAGVLRLGIAAIGS